jgi:hypothetical protein
MQAPAPEEVLKQALAQVDAETESSILAGFYHTVQGQEYHFSYNLIDQLNFNAALNAAQLGMAGIPGIPTTVDWNGWEREFDEEGNVVHRHLTVLTLTVPEFIDLAFNGGMAHRLARMAEGTARKEQLIADFEAEHGFRPDN